MKFKNFRQVDNKTYMNAESPFINFIYGLQAKHIIKKMRKQFNIPKSTRIIYKVAVSFEFNAEEKG